MSRRRRSATTRGDNVRATPDGQLRDVNQWREFARALGEERVADIMMNYVVAKIANVIEERVGKKKRMPFHDVVMWSE